MVPRGTHHWDDFVTPDELRDLLADAGLAMGEPRGIAVHAGRALHLSDDLALNYIVTVPRLTAMIVGDTPRPLDLIFALRGSIVPRIAAAAGHADAGGGGDGVVACRRAHGLICRIPARWALPCSASRCRLFLGVPQQCRL